MNISLPAVCDQIHWLDALPKRATPLPVGQLYWPSWEQYEASFQDLFDRQYYTNHGPLLQQLELKLAERLQVKHAICVSNATIGLVMAAEALCLKGKVIVPSFTFIATVQSLTWAGLEPVFCDVDPITHQLSPSMIEQLISSDVSAILGVNLWGGSCNPVEIEALAHRYGIPVYFDSAHAMACEINGIPIGSFGALEVFSFHATKVLSAGEGGCITTNSDELAAKLRNIRSSYGAGPAVHVVKTSNGRMSEAHAALALMNLEQLPVVIEKNKEIFKSYECGLSGIPGIQLIYPCNVSYTNYQYIVCRLSEEDFGLSRDQLVAILVSRNIIARRYFTPGAHRSTPYVEQLPQFVDALPITDMLNKQILQLPIGSLVSINDVGMICDLIRSIQKMSKFDSVIKEKK
ncbi:DegT/DnrJ/EryC1/StrS family aminotransferase [Paludibacterium denitrificans]|uniref:DegT/DnrJ/EryC1/StrS family aminotransferase n=1 Tax=Paludibacterium denitrificans TaxID=2675226 RepID=A0A844GC47_9NEIS|nr:DegT/DnrJ/EryC1/StrS family aminotransferase [Paludibacterium denitrificans]MTD32871.1 DegT/DnrJ/EryC1/StrS family aminotransferase [Paludibacterium denitrificans]